MTAGIRSRGRASAILWILCGALAAVSPAAAEDARAMLQGTWTAARAQRDGESAEDVVGHRLLVRDDRFEIRSRDGTLLYGGTLRLDPSAKPASIDFDNTEGSQKGKVWKGIYAFEGDTLSICDNAPNPTKDRPAAFEAKRGSGYVLITFRRAAP